eukprot:6458865-Lingulodinium_polyedra.AAC.1
MHESRTQGLCVEGHRWMGGDKGAGGHRRKVIHRATSKVKVGLNASASHNKFCRLRPQDKVDPGR